MEAARSAERRRTRARRGEGDKLRAEILAAAERLLTQTSDESAVSVRAVADAVGVTAPSIYLHFADKDELLVAVCERNFDELSFEVERAASRAADPAEVLRLAMMAYARFGLEHPEQYRILFMRKAAPETESAEHERLRNSSGFNFVLAAVVDCMEAGIMRRDDPFLAAVALWSVVHGITSLLISKPAFPWPPLEQFLDYTVRAHLKGVRA